MDSETLPNDIDACHQLIAELQFQVGGQVTAIQQATKLSHKDKLIEEQAHSVLALKADQDKIDEAKNSRRRNRPTASDRKFPVHLPRFEKIVDLPEEDQTKGLDDAERLARRQSLSRHSLDLIAEYLDSEVMQ